MKTIGQCFNFYVAQLRSQVRSIAGLGAFLLLAAPAMAEWELVQAHADWSPRAFHRLQTDPPGSDAELTGGVKDNGDEDWVDFWTFDVEFGWFYDYFVSITLAGEEPCLPYQIVNTHNPGWGRYIFGGGTCFERGCCAMNDLVECYDFEGGCEWFAYPSLQWSPRLGHVTLYRGGLKFLSVGGLFPGTPLDHPAPEARKYFNEVWLHLQGRPSEEQQAEPILAPWAGRYGHSCVAVGDTLVLAGGFVEDSGPLGEKAVNDVWTSTDEGVNWSLATAEAPWSARGFHGCAVVDGRVWIVGGSDGAGNDFADTWYSDDLGVTWNQYRAQAPWTARHGHAIADIQGTLWLTGGRTSQGTYFNDVWRLNTEPIPIHTADQDANGRVSLSELLRVVQFYSFGAFHCEDGTEDNYAPNVGDQSCAHYGADYNPADWRIDLSELLRLIQLYSAGGYVPCETGEDGFCLAD
jgi:hypothetical protein